MKYKIFHKCSPSSAKQTIYSRWRVSTTNTSKSCRSCWQEHVKKSKDPHSFCTTLLILVGYFLHENPTQWQKVHSEIWAKRRKVIASFKIKENSKKFTWNSTLLCKMISYLFHVVALEERNRGLRWILPELSSVIMLTKRYVFSSSENAGLL